MAAAGCCAKLSVSPKSLCLSFILENQNYSKKFSVSSFWPPRAKKDCIQDETLFCCWSWCYSQVERAVVLKPEKNTDLKVSHYSRYSKGTLIPSFLPERLNHCIRSSVISALRLCDSKYYISFPPSSPILNFFNKIQVHCKASPEASWDHVSGL